MGHTYMSTDEFHHQVELSLKQKKGIHDFEDFHHAVSDTHSNITVKSMNISAFCRFEDSSIVYKLQSLIPRVYMKNMCQVTFERGLHTIKFKLVSIKHMEYWTS